MRGIRGMAYFAHDTGDIPFPFVTCPSYEEVLDSKEAYARAVKMQYDEADHVRGKAVVQAHGKRVLIQNPPSLPLSMAEMDKVYSLPFARTYHPSYEAAGGVPAIQEVQFSIIHNRGCFGACNFCALAFHQGRYIQGPLARFGRARGRADRPTPRLQGLYPRRRRPDGKTSASLRVTTRKSTACAGISAACSPTACKNLEADHRDYLTLLRRLRAIPASKRSLCARACATII